MENWVFFLANVCVFIATIYLLWLFNRRKSKSGEPPVVDYWIPWFGVGFQFNNDPLKYLKKCEKKYGPIFTLCMGGEFHTVVMDISSFPAIAKQSKKLSFKESAKSIGTTAFAIKHNPMNSNAPTIGKYVPQHFQGTALDNQIEKTMECFHEVFSHPTLSSSEWKKIGVQEFCNKILFRTTAKVIFGSVLDNKSDEYMEAILQDFQSFDNIFPYLVRGIPLSLMKKANKGRENMWELLKKVKEDETFEMFSSHLEDLRFDEDKGFDITIEKIYFIIMWAAQSNTVLSVFWILYLLLKHPEALEAGRREIEDTLKKTSQDPKSDFILSRSDFDEMKVLESIIKESMRLTVSSAMSRKAVEDCDVKIESVGRNYRIRKGDNILALYQLVHYDGDIYNEPSSFKYDRFLNEDKQKFCKNGKPIRYYLQPFGSGVSKCPGRYWAMSEIKQFLSLVLLRYDLKLVDPQQTIKTEKYRIGLGTLTPTSDLKMYFKCK